MKRAPLSVDQLFRISWWLLVIAFITSIIDWYFLDSEYRDYLRILGIIAFAGYLIGLVYNMQKRTQDDSNGLPPGFGRPTNKETTDTETETESADSKNDK